jgi:hypothetical protein
VPAIDNNESFRKFLDTLTKNGSDKVFHALEEIPEGNGTND